MMPYIHEKLPRINIYVANFPTADPNIPHTMKELREGGMVEKKERKNGLVCIDEAGSVYGEKYDILVKEHDFAKIAKDFDMSGSVRVHSSTRTSLIFTDDKNLISIKKDIVKTSYTKDRIDEKTIYALRALRKNISHTGLFKYLTETFYNERSTEFADGYLLQLSPIQVSEVQKYFPDIHFDEYYDKEYGGNIFVQWEDALSILHYE